MQNAARNAASVAPASPGKFTYFLNQFGQYKDTVERIMPTKAIEADRVITICAMVVANSEQLQKCDIKSLIGAVIEAALHGMNPNPANGLVYFVPYGGKVQLMLGYKGQELQAYKSGMVKSIAVRCIYEGDDYKIDLAAEDPILYHNPGPNYGSNDPSKIIWAYSKIYLVGGGMVCQPINRLQIEQRRMASKSPSGSTNPWSKYYAKMAMKSAIRESLAQAPKHDDWRDIDGSVTSLESYKTDRSGQRTAASEIETITDFDDIPAAEVQETEPEQPSDGLTPGQRIARDEQAAKDARKNGSLFGQEGAAQP